MIATRSRSLVKAITWRALGTADTFVLSVVIISIYSNDIQWQAAYYIAFLEIITKSIFYYVHERIWNKFNWQRTNFVSKLRSFVKALTWRILATVDTFLLSFIVTQELKWATSIALFEILTKAILYYLHERGWNKLNWGRS